MLFVDRVEQRAAQGCRFATSVDGVLTGRGADIIMIDDPLSEFAPPTRPQSFF